MKKVTSKMAVQPAVSPEIEAQLRAAAALPDHQIDTTDPDAGEVTDWSGAVRGRFYRPIKKHETLRIDDAATQAGKPQRSRKRTAP